VLAFFNVLAPGVTPWGFLMITDRVVNYSAEQLSKSFRSETSPDPHHAIRNILSTIQLAPHLHPTSVASLRNGIDQQL
jgi:hypothetical protein